MEDLGLILGQLLERAAGERASSLKLTPEFGRALLAHDWPLNVRELNQALGVALALARGTTLDVEHVPASIRLGDAEREGEGTPSNPPPAPVAERPRASTPPPAIPEDDASLRALVLAQLEAHRGNISDVSRALGKTRMQIHRWMKRFAIDPESFRS
jgi:DNA-binding NtrC family response regulator